VLRRREKHLCNSGEAARFCRLDLAPEAPWRCPDDCPKYKRRLADVGWVHGSLVSPPVEAAPDVPAAEASELLSQAEEIVNEIAPGVLADVRAEDARQERKANRRTRRWWRGRG